MERETLNPNEFAIETGADFTLQGTGPAITVSNDGILSITFKYAVDKVHLQVNSRATPMKINEDFLSCGIFDKSTKIWFMDPSSLPTSFTLDSVPTSDIIKLNSDKASYNLMTAADKGRQGDALFNIEQEKSSRNPHQ